MRIGPRLATHGVSAQSRVGARSATRYGSVPELALLARRHPIPNLHRREDGGRGHTIR
jgi:hypothetical protein